MHSPATLAYFCAQPERCFWKWESKDSDFADLIDWQDDDKLIVLRQELEGILAAFTPQGFPPLGSLLLVLDALNADWLAGRLMTRLAKTASLISGEKSMSGVMAEKAMDVGHRLGFIAKLPKELTASGPARHRLLRTLFEGHPDLLEPAVSRTILAQFVQTTEVNVFAQRSPELNGIARLLKDLAALEKAFQLCPPEHLEERLRTGLDEMPSEQLLLPWSQPDETAVPEPPAELLRALEKEGGELAQVAGLVRRMTALLHVPKRVTQREELPLGGVSDITNRGDPSRLLMTELAWDDLTFAVRLAQGESLYLRRESPPAEPPPKRLLLIDNGIFMWGKPRLFALGAAMALLRQKLGPHAPVGTVLTLQENSFVPITLETVEDVRTQLTRLEPQPHPGRALAMLDMADDSPFSADQEVFVLTHAAALEVLMTLPVWQKLAQQVPLHTLLVDRDGALELARHSPAGARVLSKARVEAEDLFGPAPAEERAAAKPPPLPLTSEFARLPRFYQRHPWPLYVPASPEPNQVFQIGGKGFVGISSTGAVCLWTMQVHVGRVLAPNAPTKNLGGVTVDPESDDRLLMLFCDHAASCLRVLVVDLQGREKHRLITYQGRLHEVHNLRIQSGALILTDHGVMKALSLEDGRLLASMNVIQHQGMPWFDGERLQPNSDKHRQPAIKLITPAVPRPISKIHRIHEITRVGFGVMGGLLIQKEKGRTYALSVKKGTLEWRWSTDAKGHFKPLIPLSLSEWPECGLSQATFPDGRRVIHDSRGFLHVCNSGDDEDELSLLMVKGKTAAWQQKGFYYGDPALLWSEALGADSVLQTRTQKLFRAVTATPVAVKPRATS